MRTTLAQKADKAEAVERLQKLLKPGDTVYTIVTRVARSGMSRHIRAFVMRDNEPYEITYAVGRVIGERNGEDGINISGCGMDMGFEVVYRLSNTLFPAGFGEVCHKCGKRPQSQAEAKYVTDAANGAAEAMHGNDDHTCTFQGRNGDMSGWDSSGGYALKQRWL